jgi:dipeptidyl aminopeptidase/acylaminoacyl peptidase
MVIDQEKRMEIGRQLSPVNHVSADDPPTFIMHGDADPIVPLQQSRLIIEKLKDAGIPCELVVKPGGAHGWLDIGTDVPKLVDWFDKYLARK